MTIIALVLATAVAAVLGAGAAAAKPRSRAITLTRVVNIEVNDLESGGYRLGLRATKFLPPPGEEDGGRIAFVTLTARRGTGAATYYAPAAIDPDSLKADFDRLGELDARFEPSAPGRAEPLKGCEGATRIKQRGWIVGKIRFRGERGYTSLRAGRLPGVRWEIPQQTCRVRVPGSTPENDEKKKVTMEGLSHSGRSRIGFSAIRDHPGAPIEFQAWSEERLGPVAITRSVEVKGGGNTFAFDTGLTKAEVHPPAPFRGDAFFQAITGKQTGTWLGPLMVSFPGRSDVRLAGKRFRGDLVTGSECPFDHQASCFEVTFTS